MGCTQPKPKQPVSNLKPDPTPPIQQQPQPAPVPKISYE